VTVGQTAHTVNEFELVPAQAYSLFVHQQTIVERDVLGAVKYVFKRVKGNKGKFVIPDEDMEAFVLAKFTTQTRQDEWYTGEGPMHDVFQTHMTELADTTCSMVLAIIGGVAGVVADIAKRAKLKKSVYYYLRQLEELLQTQPMPCDSQQVYNRICVVREQLSQAASNWDRRRGMADKTIDINLPAKFAELQIKYKDLESKNADLTEELSQSQDGLNRLQDNLKRPSVSSKNKSSSMSLIFRTCR
jgi:hypothetical protein